ncbi:hypothetical protein MRX96_035170 [Rhipicephalus microplus]
MRLSDKPQYTQLSISPRKQRGVIALSYASEDAADFRDIEWGHRGHGALRFTLFARPPLRIIVSVKSLIATENLCRARKKLLLSAGDVRSFISDGSSTISCPVFEYAVSALPTRY